MNLRFIIRDGEKVLQMYTVNSFRAITPAPNCFGTWEPVSSWQDVPLVPQSDE